MRIVPYSGDCRVGVEEGHDIEFGLGMRAVEVAQQTCWREPPADYVDAQRAAAGTHGGGCPLFGLEEIAGVGQERLPVNGELGSARSAGEQPHAEVLLKRGDACWPASPAPRAAIAIAGLLILTTPLLLPRHDHTLQRGRKLARSRT